MAPAPAPPDGPNAPDHLRLYEWLLRASFGILVLLSVYTVLGDDLAQLLGAAGSKPGASSQPPPPPAQ